MAPSGITKSMSKSHSRAPIAPTGPTADALLAAAQRPPPRPSAEETLTGTNLALLQSGKFSDLTLRCRRSLRTYSPTESATTPSEWEEFKESESNVIELMDEEVDDVHRMLEFCYGRKYWEHPETEPASPSSTPTSTPTSSEGKDGKKTPSDRLYERYRDDERVRSEDEKRNDPVMVNIRMYAMGDKFGIPALKKHALKQIQRFSELTVGKLVSKRTGTGKRVLVEPRVEERAELVIRQWARIVEAATFVWEKTEDEEVLKLLVDPIARVSPWLTEIDKAKFDELLKRLATTVPEFCMRMFEKSCLESQKERTKMLEHFEEERVDWRANLKEIKADRDMWMAEAAEAHELRKSVTTFVDKVSDLLKRPASIKVFRCVYENCSSSKVLLPYVRGDTISFRCQDCGETYDANGEIAGICW
ncbi:hypothetical protein BJ508DRAFT_310823 [Ascobolus immersus RN42]|uniref:BTB domain-containing protein n=1 Tax=Ascobolus immersus RN42 TaxID=1160509 RepID=A0A3N4HXV9_ASCIM|nr:hypothetical protein BJ508DRAFT_310823 [Ascobolus immersus RN42]